MKPLSFISEARSSLFNYHVLTERGLVIGREGYNRKGLGASFKQQCHWVLDLSHNSYSHKSLIHNVVVGGGGAPDLKLFL